MGFQVDLKGGKKLVATRVAGMEEPVLGIQEGQTFVVLAKFISDADMAYLQKVFTERIIVIQPLSD